MNRRKLQKNAAKKKAAREQQQKKAVRAENVNRLYSDWIDVVEKHFP